MADGDATELAQLRHHLAILAAVVSTHGEQLHRLQAIIDQSKREADPRHLLTPEDLAKRWKTTTETVWDRVDDEVHPLPWIYIGNGRPAKGRGRRGQRGLYRFRIQDIEAWETVQVRTFAAATGDERPMPSAGTLSCWDGKVRGRKPGTRIIG